MVVQKAGVYNAKQSALRYAKLGSEFPCLENLVSRLDISDKRKDVSESAAHF